MKTKYDQESMNIKPYFFIVSVFAVYPYIANKKLLNIFFSVDYAGLP